LWDDLKRLTEGFIGSNWNIHVKWGHAMLMKYFPEKDAGSFARNVEP